MRLAERRRVVLDVLEDVQADDRIDRFGGERRVRSISLDQELKAPLMAKLQGERAHVQPYRRRPFTQFSKNDPCPATHIEDQRRFRPCSLFLAPYSLPDLCSQQS